MLKSFGWKKETELEKSVKRLKANDPSLNELNLYYNSIGDDGAKAIAEALKDNAVLTTLDLRNLISIGRSKMDEAIDKLDSRPIELPKEFIMNCTNNLAEERKLGHGSFGAVYKGMDDNRYFAVKCLRFNLDFLEDQKKGISKTFKKELEVSSSVVSSIACSFKFLHFSFFHHTVSGIKEVPTQSYCNFVRLSFVPCFI
jgi:hypothetical protein